MKIRFIGSGAAVNSSMAGASILVDDKLLVDTHPGCASNLRRYNVNLPELECICVTHLHGDHYFGLPILLMQYRLEKRDSFLFILGHDGLKEKVTELLRLGFPDVDTEKVFELSKVKFQTPNIGASYNCFGELFVEPLIAKHTIPTFGYLITDNKKHIYYSADTAAFDEMSQYISFCDIIILDATTKDTAVNGHMSLKQIDEIAEQYPDKVFFANHRGDYEVEELSSVNVILPADGDEFSF